MNRDDIEKPAAAGESETVEFKRSTGQLGRAGKSLCAFLIGGGGRVVIGVTDAGKVVGQDFSDETRREIATMLSRFDPSVPVDVECVELAGGARTAIVLEARRQFLAGPFTFDGRACQRVQKTTSIMPRERRAHLEPLAMVREPIAWLDRTTTLAAQFPPGQIFREGR